MLSDSVGQINRSIKCNYKTATETGPLASCLEEVFTVKLFHDHHIS